MDFGQVVMVHFLRHEFILIVISELATLFSSYLARVTHFFRCLLDPKEDMLFIVLSDRGERVA